MPLEGPRFMQRDEFPPKCPFSEIQGIKSEDRGVDTPVLDGSDYSPRFTYPLLREVEVRFVGHAVFGHENCLAARASPHLVRLPDQLVLVRIRVIGEATSPCRDKLRGRDRISFAAGAVDLGCSDQSRSLRG